MIPRGEAMKMLSLCGDGHDEICYTGRECPACEALDRVQQIQDQVIEAERAYNDMEEQAKVLERKVEDLQDEINELEDKKDA